MNPVLFLPPEKRRRRSRNRKSATQRRRLRVQLAGQRSIRDPKVEEAPPSSR